MEVITVPGIGKTLPWQGIVVHHTSNPTQQDFYKRPDHDYWIRVIDRAHRLRKFKKIGYHFVIFPDGVVKSGRALTEVGAHTQGHNFAYIGICVFGNFEQEYPTDKQKTALHDLVRKFCSAFGWHKKDKRFLFGHHEFRATDCPGAHLKPFVKQLETMVRKELAAT